MIIFIIFFLAVLLIIIGIVVGLGVLLYRILKRKGYLKTAKYLTIGYTLIIVSLFVYFMFPNIFFTKREAKKLIAEQGIFLNDDFSILSNNSTSVFGDYYQTFTLHISSRDREMVIQQIKAAENFTYKASCTNDLLMQGHPYYGEKIIQNYETADSYVREYFEPSGEQGYAPTFRRIRLKKNGHKIVFEDIDELTPYNSR